MELLSYAISISGYVSFRSLSFDLVLVDNTTSYGFYTSDNRKPSKITLTMFP